MRYGYSPLRPCMTAVAAVFALSSTPLLAQEASPVESSAPVVVAPPPAASAPAMETAPATTSSLNIPKITVNMDDAPKEASPAPSMQRAVEPRTAPPAQPRTVAQVEKPASTVSTNAPVESATVPPAPVAAETPLESAATPPTPVPAGTRQVVADDNLNEAVPIAGGILGALALAGGAFAFVARRRRDRDVTIRESAVADEPMTAPVFEEPARAFTTAPALATELPDNFDMARYGRHVQAAYRGPTADNPSLSLRKRLKRARFYDQRERMAASAVEPAPAAPRQEPASRPERTPEYVTSRRFSGGNTSFRPAFQN